MSPRDGSRNAALETPEFELCFPVLKKVNLCYIKSFGSCRIATLALRELAESDIKLAFCLETCLRFDSRGCLRVLFVPTSSFPTPTTLPHHALPKGKRRKSILIFTLTISVHNVTMRTYLSIIGNVLLIIKMANCFLSTWVVFLVLLLRTKMILFCHNICSYSLMDQRFWKKRKIHNDKGKEYRRLILSRSWPWAFEFP